MAEFVCRVKEENPDYLSACKDLPKYPGTQYCVLHHPDEEKNKEDFLKVVKSKLEQQDYDFSGTVFPEGTSDFSRFVFDGDADFTGANFVGKADFSEAQFSGEITDFRETQFSGELTNFIRTTFDCRYTNFTAAAFSGAADFSFAYSGGEIIFARASFELVAYFHGTYLRDAIYENAHFYRAVDFTGAKFEGIRERVTDFRRVIFEGALDFREAAFNGYVDFYGATFLDTVLFSGRKILFSEHEEIEYEEQSEVFAPGGRVSFLGTNVRVPESVSFHAMTLHPSSFLDMNGVDKFDFTDVRWYGLPGGPEGSLDSEISYLVSLGVGSPYGTLAQVCRELARNAGENRPYTAEASVFTYWALEAERKAHWNGITPWKLSWWYWLSSGYGERPFHAFMILTALWSLFAVLYMLVGPPEFHWLSASNLWDRIGNAGQAGVYSLNAITRQNLDPKPNTGFFTFLVSIEGILGPLQIALLLLAMRRKLFLERTPR